MKMKQLVLRGTMLILLVSTLFTACSQKKEVSKGDLKTLVDSASYCIGTNIGIQFKSQDMEINPEILMNAFYAAFGGDTSHVIRLEDAQGVLMEYDKMLQEKHQTIVAKKGKQNRDKAEKFLAENKTREGVQTTISGLQYKVITEGSGKKPGPENRVRLEYRLKLIDGAVVESTFERDDEPVIMGLNQLIPGMNEALQLMPEGSKYMFWISPNLGYGDMDSPDLPAGSLLFFEVELIEVIVD